MANFETDRYTKDSSASETSDRERTSTSDKLRAELGVGGAFLAGAGDKLTELYEHPQTALPSLLTGTALGVAVGYFARGTYSRKIMQNLGKYTAVAMTADIAAQTGPALYSAWKQPETAQQQADRLGHNLAGLSVDYLLMGIGAYGGSKAFVRAHALSPSASAPLKDTEKLSQLIKSEFKPPQSLSGLDLNDPKVLAELSNYKRTGTSSLPLKELDEATKSLESAINKWTASRNMPDVQVKWNLLNGSRGNAAWDVSLINVDPVTLVRPSPAEIAEVTVHELTHRDQKVTVLRRLADRLGIGKTASSSELLSLNREYCRSYAHEYAQPDYLQAVIRMRDGQILSTAQARRADFLMSHHNVIHEAYAARTAAIGRDRFLASALEQVKTPNGARDFVAQLKDKEFCEAWFNSEQPPQLLRDLVKSTSADRPWTATETANAQKILAEALNIEKSLIAPELATNKIRYRRLPNEVESFKAGNLAAWNTYTSTTPGRLKFLFSTAATGDLFQQGTNSARRYLLPLAVENK